MVHVKSITKCEIMEIREYGPRTNLPRDNQQTTGPILVTGKEDIDEETTKIPKLTLKNKKLLKRD